MKHPSIHSAIIEIIHLLCFDELAPEVVIKSVPSCQLAVWVDQHWGLGTRVEKTDFQKFCVLQKKLLLGSNRAPVVDWRGLGRRG